MSFTLILAVSSALAGPHLGSNETMGSTSAKVASMNSEEQSKEESLDTTVEEGTQAENSEIQADSSGLPVGEIFVSSPVEGLPIFLDGMYSGQKTPAVLKDISVGKHKIEIRTECQSQMREVDVRKGFVERAELSLSPYEASQKPSFPIRIMTEPEGAIVQIDGENHGTSPYSTSIPCGKHELEIRLFGYVSESVTFQSSPFDPELIAIQLTPEEYGTLILKPTPLSTQIHLDGISQGSGPMTLADLSVGTYKLKFTAEGYDPLKKTVKLKQDQVQTIQVELQPAGTALKQEARSLLWVSSLGVSSAVMGYASLYSYLQAREPFLVYLNMKSDSKAELFYDQQVLPYRNRSILLGVGSVAFLGGSVYSWMHFNDKINVAFSPLSQGIQVRGLW